MTKTILDFGKTVQFGDTLKACPTDAFRDIPNKVAFTENPNQLEFSIRPPGCVPKPFKNTDPQSNWTLWVLVRDAWELAAKAENPSYNIPDMPQNIAAARQIDDLFEAFCTELEDSAIQEARIVPPAA